jgi:hypothetical protein
MVALALSTLVVALVTALGIQAINFLFPDSSDVE